MSAIELPVSFYVDTSAYLKLIVAEEESTVLRAWVGDQQRGDPNALISSEVLRLEAIRALRRQSPQAVLNARRELSAMTVIPLTSDILARASEIDPPALRSLDAIHLASALDQTPPVEAFVTYDLQLAGAASDYGLAVFAPG